MTTLQDTGNSAADPFLGVRRSAMEQEWVLRPCIDREAEALASRMSISITLARILCARNVPEETIASFLNPSLRDSMPDPSVVLDMDKAVTRIVRALQQKERIAIFGDYDVDGATSSAVLKRFFDAVGAKDTLIYIPDRMAEGYGPNAAAMTALRDQGVDVVITVDCGTLSFAPLQHAKDIGLDVIVVDHHKAEPELPPAVAVVNPNRLDDDSDLGHLAAVGVAYLLAIAVNRALRGAGWFTPEQAEPNLLGLLDIVALGTVCDVVPLVGLNRAFVAQGLKVMAKRQNAGIAALSDVARVSEAPNTYHAGFLLGPRVNAGGRVGSSELGAKLLTTNDRMTASMIAEQLNGYNQDRQAIEQHVLSEALEMAERIVGLDGKPPAVLVVASEGWHPGVIGIVASRLKDKYRVPTFVIAIEDGEGKGSGRSISGVDLGAGVIEAVQRGILVKGGGHAMAAGLTVAPDRIDDLTSFLTDMLGKAVEKASEARKLVIDVSISMMGATPSLVDDIETLGPFGVGNSAPRFAIPDVVITKADRVGQNHVRVIAKGKDGGSMKVMAFRQADEPLGQMLLNGVGQHFHLAGKLKKDLWTGAPKVEMTLEDAAPRH
ncbi:single-stranded-DNA-specific exonuclease RecJ [Kordiimonas sediminis]|uniref:Single-stranded-DNA-specific exonuclease RecJ n=1 Tax=Kordiimonas sediminis TaxID=1735581 RepID=A0A919AUX9_9PROT|nr:single-stranded-DNA-specific exonuclease RecJ [Kordiimonas sediminis]GHF26123.1 single-stranded-DNA-specific exonuclease RecJ [Kordiimonas sediminis]